MDEILLTLLNRLETIGERHEELYDTEVRQAIGNATMDGFVRGKADFSLPADFGMFTESSNSAVRDAVAEYIAAASQKAAELGISEFRDRMAHLQNRGVHSPGGYDYEEFLGHSPPEFYDESGKVVRTY